MLLLKHIRANGQRRTYSFKVPILLIPVTTHALHRMPDPPVPKCMYFYTVILSISLSNNISHFYSPPGVHFAWNFRCVQFTCSRFMIDATSTQKKNNYFQEHAYFFSFQCSINQFDFAMVSRLNLVSTGTLRFPRRNFSQHFICMACAFQAPVRDLCSICVGRALKMLKW